MLADQIMTKISTQIAIITMVLLFGCSTTEYRKYNGHIQELPRSKVYEGTIERVHSDRLVLETYKFSGGCIVPTFAGYSLFIEGDTDDFQNDTVINIPNKTVEVLYYRDYHHVGWIERDFIGKINVIEVTNNYLFAEIDLKQKRSDKTFHFKAKFKNRSIGEFRRFER